MNRYLKIIKPGIVLGNLLSVTGSFLLCSHGTIKFHLLFYLLLGTSLVIASNCVLNNIIDVAIDSQMNRTLFRVLPTNKMSIKVAYIYAVWLSLLGFLCLYFFVNVTSVLLCLFATFIYVIVYSLIMKQRSVYSTVVGSLSGAIPPVIGYTAVNNKLDFCAFLLYLMYFFWQIPHSYSIFIYRLEEYRKANIPVYPLVKSLLLAKHVIIVNIIVCIYITLMFFIYDYTGVKHLIICCFIEFIWLLYSIYGYWILDTNQWAYKLFILSIIIIISFNVMIAIDFKTH